MDKIKDHKSEEFRTSLGQGLLLPLPTSKGYLNHSRQFQIPITTLKGIFESGLKKPSKFFL